MGKGKKKRGPKAKNNRGIKSNILEGVIQYQEYSLSESRSLNSVKISPRSLNQEHYLKKLKNNTQK